MSKRSNVILLAIIVLLTVFILFLLNKGKIREYNENAGDNQIRFENEELTEAEKEREHTLTFLKPDNTVDFTVCVEHGEKLVVLPESSNSNGILYGWYNVSTGIELTLDTYILEDATYYGRFWNIENYIQNSEIDIEQIDTDKIRELADYVRSLQH